ncbi:MAG TPA: carbohydrate-binding domain-containing protein, partial [Azospirillum sp.]|nr:carbohydrate-binding domain-containing protein [Azospirillum sp.]
MLGVNLSGAEFGSKRPGTYGTDYVYPSMQALDYYDSKGLTLIRLPFLWERVQHNLNGPLDTAEVGRIRTVLDGAAARGMKVILDLHNYGRYFDQPLGSIAVPTTALADVWSKLAAQFKGHAGLGGYDLMNEPHDMPNATVWPTAAQQAVNAIRKVDTGTTVIVEGDGWAGAHSWKAINANLLIKDPANKLVYQAHQYFDNDSSGTYDQSYDGEGAYANIGVDRTKPFVEWLQQHNVEGFIGEFGVPQNDPRWLTVEENFLKYLDQNGISSTAWAGGPWWGSYPLSIEPTNGVDKPLMGVLTQYVNNTDAAIYTSGATGGTPNLPPAPLPPTPTPTPAAGISTIVVNALGAPAGGVNAHFKVLIDGKPIGEAMTSTSAKDYTFTTNAATGVGHKVQVQYDNDANVNGVDRNLIVNKVTINGKAVSPTDGIVTIDRGAFDGQDMLPGQTGIWWKATMIIGADKSFFPASSGATAPTAGASTIVVNALGAPAGGVNAHFKVLIDGKKIGEGTAGTTAKDFTFSGTVSADAAHKVQIQYDNDAVINGQDRNLTVNKVTINGKAVLPTASNVSY